MRAAAAAVQLMCEKRLKKSGDQAFFFQPLPIDPEDLLSSPPINSDEQYQDIDNNSKYDILWQKINALMEESVEKMRSNRDFATSIRAFLLGSNPTAAKIKEIDNFFREFGFLGES